MIRILCVQLSHIPFTELIPNRYRALKQLCPYQTLLIHIQSKEYLPGINVATALRTCELYKRSLVATVRLLVTATSYEELIIQ